MHEIICPHCSKAFKIDDAGYADILCPIAPCFEIALCTPDVATALERAVAAGATPCGRWR